MINFEIQGKCYRHIPDRVVDNGLGLYGMSHVSINIIQQIHDGSRVQFIKLYKSIEFINLSSAQSIEL